MHKLNERVYSVWRLTYLILQYYLNIRQTISNITKSVDINSGVKKIKFVLKYVLICYKDKLYLVFTKKFNKFTKFDY